MSNANTLRAGRMTVWAETIVRAAHTMNGHCLHGHTYRVRVSVVTDETIDSEALHHDVQTWREGIDHDDLNEVLPAPTMEAMARAFAMRAAASGYTVAAVRVDRPLEGIGCEWRP